MRPWTFRQELYTKKVKLSNYYPVSIYTFNDIKKKISFDLRTGCKLQTMLNQKFSRFTAYKKSLLK